jgi:hypothetical protein
MSTKFFQETVALKSDSCAGDPGFRPVARNRHGFKLAAVRMALRRHVAVTVREYPCLARSLPEEAYD